MKRTLQERIGHTGTVSQSPENDKELVQFINIKLAALDLPVFGNPGDYPFLEIGKSLLANMQVKDRLLGDYLCPVDQSIQDYLTRVFKAQGIETNRIWLPTKTFTLERHGLARMLSLPADGDEFESDILNSYRTQHGVLHNPRSDRRTTKGVFHVVEGGSPVPNDKKAVPAIAFSRMLEAALNPPESMLELPFTSTQSRKARSWVSLLLRPLLCPKIEGFTEEKSMEVRFFAPGSMVANLDFVESIFGNAGNPLLPENDARLDPDGWSGHTGCVILAPHLTTLTKKAVGLPHISKATDLQKRDGMCWEDEDELYNDGSAFKLTCRNHEGIVVTLIADNYFGYCKKEVKTQLSYASNLFGLVEEEHAGGALAFPSFDLGEDFHLSYFYAEVDHNFEETIKRYGDRMEVKPEGYAVDTTYPDIIYVPEDVHIDLRSQSITWTRGETENQIKLLPETTYVLPSGYKVQMVYPRNGQRWRLIGTTAEGLVCHKPCTVSGGGKSEISKPISDAMVNGPVVTTNFQQEMDLVEEIVTHDFADRYKQPAVPGKPSRSLLSPERSLGSVVRLLTPNPEYTDEYNAWLDSFPQRVRDLVLTVKRFHRPHWGENWRERFHVDLINGQPGFELRYRKRPVIASYLRVGFHEESAWRIFNLRKDFWPATKLQREDDITAAVVVPRTLIQNLPVGLTEKPSYKFVQNCEYRLFQRPDDAIIPGYDKNTERDFSLDGNFFSNYHPLTRDEVKEIAADAIRFQQFTDDTRESILAYLADENAPGFYVCTANPRIVDGSPTKNPRYLQTRPDLGKDREEYLADMGARMLRRIPLDQPVMNPVGAVLPGRRNNPPQPEAGIRPLAVFNPIHYQELPELFMDFIASLTGKSPSTTGAGSEGALTKGPFNALLPIVDLNNALVSYLVTESHGFSTAAGYVGHKYKVDHDISLLVPEIWCRMYPYERDPKWLIENGYLEKLEDFEHEGETIPASRLGYRMTATFARNLFGRVFSHPDSVLTQEMLKPELQSMEFYVDGIRNIVEAQRKAALNYFEDGSIEMACPPLKALLHIMAYGEYEGKDVTHPDIRKLFDPASLHKSDWYHDRLVNRYRLECQRLRANLQYLESYRTQKPGPEIERQNILQKIESVRKRLNHLESRPESAIQELDGTLGTDPGLTA